MVLTETERKQRRVDGMKRKTEGMTEVEKIQREFTVGRPPVSELRTPAEAVRAASLLFAELQAAMKAHNVADPVCAVKVAYVDTDFSMTSTQVFIPGKESELLKFLTKQPVIMLGLVFVMLDPEADESKRHVLGMKPFLVTRQVVGWLKDLITQQHSGLN